MESDDSFEGVRPASGELAPEVWAAKLLNQLDPAAASEPIEEPVEEAEVDESAWQAALAAAHARAADEPVVPAAAAVTNEGIADETGPHETLTAEVPKAELDALVEESAPIHEADAVVDPEPVAEPE